MNQTNQLNIRRAELADAAPLVELASRIYYETFAAVNTPENMQAYISSAFTVKQLRAELNEPEAAFYIGEVDGTFAAYAKLLIGQPPECVTGPSPIELVRFYVDRRWQGTGVAHNDRLIAFYRKWGFARVGEHIFQMGDDPQTDRWMMRPL